ncbi:GNAT family N-acetyltransferase [Microbulbifer pacificus]|uniref:GNAT family N-acetyltransferase n=1 Tax=Microbulbifer pacificus TaxID=407164 RepID=A0AAU0N2F8_9GAMM|nr:GNAT family N-acetyltransferase [Microbulbifer pacificus]WOX07209.1 GNAT family N-acetyltransferase [Microbulbifer pacificus]
MKSPCSLIPFKEKYLAALMGWIDSEVDCRQWGGPEFRYPFDTQSFSTDSRWRELPSFVVLDAQGEPLAFGQFYRRLNCCHLGRLIVAPHARGRGVGQQLIRQLAAQAKEVLRLEQCSLFVLKNNRAAKALYEKMGFEVCSYPEEMEWLDMCHYMVAPMQKLLVMEN